MSIEFHCPQCSKLLRTSDEKAGVKAKCPHCGGPISVPYPEAEELFDDEFDEDVEFAPPTSAFGGTRPAYSQPAPSTSRSCPRCDEPVSSTASRCRACGEQFGAPAPTQSAGNRVSPYRALDINDILSRSWKVCTSQFGMCMAAVWLPAIILGAVSGVLSGLLQVLALIAVAQPNAVGVGMSGFVVLMISAGTFAFTCFLMPGQSLMLLRLARGEPTDVSDLFKGGPYTLRMMGAQFVEKLMLTGVILLVALPTLYFAGVFRHEQGLVALTVIGGVVVGFVAAISLWASNWPFRYVLVDRNPPGLGCVKLAMETTRGNRLIIILLALVAGLVAVLGYLALCVGVLFSIPLAWMMFAIAYCDMTGQPTVR